MRLDFQARERHFLDHLAPVYEALPEELRGAFHVAPQLATRAAKLNVPATTRPLLFDRNPVLVASLGDLKMALKARRTPILMEHGAGQSYSNSNPSYSGGRSPEREAVKLFLVPNEGAAERNRRACPTASVEVVGCPKLDGWKNRQLKPNPRPVVAISFHWDCRVAPESGSAFPHYAKGVARLAASFEVLGHGHPRVFDKLRTFYSRNRIEAVRDFDEVLERSDVYACDNSSTIFEFAATDRPVVLLNAPWYRRNVHHGLRFWDCASVGISCDRPEDLVGKVEEALADSESRRAERRRIVEMVYPHLGGSAKRAVEVLAEHLR